VVSNIAEVQHERLLWMAEASVPQIEREAIFRRDP
jgi:hypothetical protein